ncbi:MAG: hypothetical protein ACREM1_00110 [Longimicrobiales bacterium]
MAAVRIPVLILVVVTGFAGGCATTRGEQGQRSNLLTRDEIMGAPGAHNLHDVVQRLRPRWLRVRAGDRSFGMTTQIAVFQDQTYFGGAEALRQLGPSTAYELLYLDGPTAASTLSGIPSGMHVGGAIVVVTRRSSY